MKTVWPKNVWIIRGNHEFAYLCGQCGFFSQITEVYGDINIFRGFLKSFSYIPIAALIGQTTLCIHGGLSPSLYSLAQLKNIQKPFDDFGDDDVIDGILWSDPSNDLREFSDSPRGTGFLFGPNATDDFMKSNKLKYLVRGHECVPDGYLVHFGSVITVFGASNYCGMVNNYSAILNFKSDGVYEPRRFPALDYLLRNYTMFVKEKNYISHEPASARNFDPKPKEQLPKLKGKTPRVSVRHHQKFQITPMKKKA
ncbi:phosphoprotein phosphatase, putative [Trichomonas vaginalis G3]|uniref:Phosphoprotein phosphatase, putative n=1 Tax=Trichomonas vaginalis (strain ATCC PRA-98 / G3) TaxID=412133 RepID=A2EID1_TRIV3|nr:phosphoprotein phosphatase protein [Trichomonas vaginalis G3]EAY07613.1 phosphoprotein phosphatase, putative [Trichomonas vaginalis G3]KAI5502501.1 phosphoprotein phosphatase protein [Trichomonas vaginalis G3]|eukprot:XP_001319836.1 phosphoprotein phosphatase [Trichomonas vaginalis G3]